MNRLTRDGTAEPVSRDQISGANAHRKIFLFPVDPDSCYMWWQYIHSYKHTYTHTYIPGTERRGGWKGAGGTSTAVYLYKIIRQRIQTLPRMNTIRGMFVFVVDLLRECYITLWKKKQKKTATVFTVPLLCSWSQHKTREIRMDVIECTGARLGSVPCSFPLACSWRLCAGLLYSSHSTSAWLRVCDKTHWCYWNKGLISSGAIVDNTAKLETPGAPSTRKHLGSGNNSRRPSKPYVPVQISSLCTTLWYPLLALLGLTCSCCWDIVSKR